MKKNAIQGFPKLIASMDTEKFGRSSYTNATGVFKIPGEETGGGHRISTFSKGPHAQSWG